MKSLVKVHHTRAFFSEGINDVDLIKLIKQEKGILITQDDRIRKNAAEIGLIREEGVSVIIIGVSANAKFDTIYTFIFKFWEKIKTQCAESKKAPFIAKILSSGEIKFY